MHAWYPTFFRTMLFSLGQVLLCHLLYPLVLVRCSVAAMPYKTNKRQQINGFCCIRRHFHTTLLSMSPKSITITVTIISVVIFISMVTETSSFLSSSLLIDTVTTVPWVISPMIIMSTNTAWRKMQTTIWCQGFSHLFWLKPTIFLKMIMLTNNCDDHF